MQPSYKHFSFRELVGKDGHGPSVEAWSDTDTHATLVYDVGWVDYQNNWPGNALGYSFMGSPPATDSFGTKRLQRIIPLRHPLYPGLWATKIAQVQPVNFQSMSTLGSSTGDPYAQYQFMRCTILFQSLPYAVLSDASLAAVSSPNGTSDESLRFVEWMEELTTETLEVPQGSLKYAEGPLAVGAQTVPSKRYQLLIKQRWTLRWWKVADNYVMTGGTAGLGNGSPGTRNPPPGSAAGTPGTGILGCVGYVNSTIFMGKPPGTLLVTGYKRNPVEAPTDPVNVGSASNDYPPRMWNLDISILEFDPPADPAFPLWHRGHNNCPTPQLASPYWYYATSNGNPVTGLPIYGSADFNKLLFKSPN